LGHAIKSLAETVAWGIFEALEEELLMEKQAAQGSQY